MYKRQLHTIEALREQLKTMETRFAEVHKFWIQETGWRLKLRKQLVEAQADVRALAQAIVVAKVTHSEMAYLSREESCPLCEPLNTALNRPGVKWLMGQQDAENAPKDPLG